MRVGQFRTGIDAGTTATVRVEPGPENLGEAPSRDNSKDGNVSKRKPSGLNRNTGPRRAAVCSITSSFVLVAITESGKSLITP